MRLHALAFLSLLALTAPGTLAAQSARWDPPGGTLAVGETTTLQLVFDGCDPRATPVPPAVDGLAFEFAGRSSNVSWINGDFSKSVTLSYAVLLSKRQAVEIPSFGVETDKGTIAVPAARFDPGAATVGGTGQALESAADSHLSADSRQVWAGEVFNLNYSIETGRNYFPDFGRGVFSWNTDPLVAEDWSRPETFDVTRGGIQRTGLAYRTRAMIRAPGSHKLNPITQLVNLNVGVTGFGFFQQRQYQQFSVQSDTPTVEVRPLPAPPAGFAGAVGDFKLVSRLVPTTASVGEPVTWTLELSGGGNWPDIHGLPSREVPGDFQVIQPKARHVPADGKIFDATLSEDIVLVPTRPGRYELGSVRFIYFDPASGGYRTLEAPSAVVSVAGAAPGPGPVPAQSPAQPAAQVPGLAAVAAAPVELPRDPLPESGGSAAIPLRPTILAALLAGPFAALAVVWLLLALGRARETDPNRARREARARLASTLARLRHLQDDGGAAPTKAIGRADPVQSQLLLRWQHDAAILWDIPHAAPSPAHFSLARRSDTASAATWADLWSEADKALYGGDRAIPAGWIARAERAVEAIPPPPFARSRLFLPRNLLPFALLAILACGALASRARAQEPAGRQSGTGASSYRRGDFAAAEAYWRRMLDSAPATAGAQYNLSLALAQQNRWDESAAHASAAFVQEPDDPAVRWQFALACGKAGYAPAPLAAFVSPGAVQFVARWASPAVWQWVMAGASLLAAAALALGLVRAYGSRPGTRLCLAAAGLALLVLFGAAASWQAYGEAASPDSAVVWRAGLLRSIPTEADVDQKTAPLAAGSVADVTKGFLGWVRLSFENGESGWVRAEEVVPLWGRRAPVK